MSEPAPTPTPSPTPAPAPTSASAETPLGFENSHGWTKVGDIVAAFNEVSGKLGNPQAPAQYDPTAIVQHYGAMTDANGQVVKDANGNPVAVFDPGNAEFGAFAAALREAGVSQKGFEKAALKFTASVNDLDAQTAQARMNDAVAKVGGAEAFNGIVAAADKAGLGKVARAASGEELVVINRMLTAANKAGGLTPPGPNPPAPGAPSPSNPADTSKYHADCQTTIDGQVVGIDPSDFNSFVEFKKFVVGAKPDGTGGRPFYKTPQGQVMLNRAQEIRKTMARDPKNNITWGRSAAPATPPAPPVM